MTGKILNLREFYDSKISKPYPTRYNSYPGGDIYRKMKTGMIVSGDVGLDEAALEMILFDINLPPCYFTETVEGTRHCIIGRSILSTIKYVHDNEHLFTDTNSRHLNQVSDVIVPVITFAFDTPDEQINEFLKGYRSLV